MLPDVKNSGAGRKPEEKRKYRNPCSFLEGAKKSNEVEVISVADVKINGCTGCNYCYRNPGHKCVFKDDMQEIYEKLSHAEIIVVATPVFFYGVSSQLKCIIDRLHNPVRNTFKVKKLVLLAVAADETPAVFNSIRAMYASVLDYFSVEDGGSVLVPGVENKGDILGNRALGEALRLG